ncbi:MAG: hypothetical protein GTN49_11125 [candidate division Zixibacteria bacterium]|nr:hypothetical protein [candidate division Zixibacteria bacterium]
MFYVSPHVSQRFSTYYGQTYVPNHFTDGVLNRIGSGNYSNYVADYNTRRVISAPLTVTIPERKLGSSTAYAKVRVALEENLPAGHTIYVGLWEDKVVVGGTYGTTPVRVMERDLATTSLTIASKGQTQNFEHTFTLQGSWKRADLGLTAWVQGPNTGREVHNAATVKLSGSSVSPSSLGRVKALFN